VAVPTATVVASTGCAADVGEFVALPASASFGWQ
jgi:hypothetical protein